MLGQEPVFEPDNVGRDPGRGPSDSREAAVRDNVVAFGDDDLVFVAQRIGCRPDQSEQSFTSRRDVRAVLDVLQRPEAFCCRVIVC